MSYLIEIAITLIQSYHDQPLREQDRSLSGADGMERRRTFRALNSSLTHSNNVDSNQLFNHFFFLIIIPSPFLIRLRGRI
jgi:hypothetical protein